MPQYSVVLIPEPEEGGYSVMVPMLPGCHTQGETVAEALTNAREAIEGHLEVLVSSGEEAPEELALLSLVTVEVAPALGMSGITPEQQRA